MNIKSKKIFLKNQEISPSLFFDSYIREKINNSNIKDFFSYLSLITSEDFENNIKEESLISLFDSEEEIYVEKIIKDINIEKISFFSKTELFFNELFYKEKYIEYLKEELNLRSIDIFFIINETLKSKSLKEIKESNCYKALYDFYSIIIDELMEPNRYFNINININHYLFNQSSIMLNKYLELFPFIKQLNFFQPKVNEGVLNIYYSNKISTIEFLKNKKYFEEEDLKPIFKRGFFGSLYLLNPDPEKMVEKINNYNDYFNIKSTQELFTQITVEQIEFNKIIKKSLSYNFLLKRKKNSYLEEMMKINLFLKAVDCLPEELESFSLSYFDLNYLIFEKEIENISKDYKKEEDIFKFTKEIKNLSILGQLIDISKLFFIIYVEQLFKKNKIEYLFNLLKRPPEEINNDKTEYVIYKNIIHMKLEEELSKLFVKYDSIKNKNMLQEELNKKSNEKSKNWLTIIFGNYEKIKIKSIIKTESNDMSKVNKRL